MNPYILITATPCCPYEYPCGFKEICGNNIEEAIQYIYDEFKEYLKTNEISTTNKDIEYECYLEDYWKTGMMENKQFTIYTFDLKSHEWVDKSYIVEEIWSRAFSDYLK